MEINKRTKRICILLLRLLALTATFVAAIVMATSHEQTTILGFSFEAKYNDIPALKYFVIANVVATIYGFLVLFVPPKNLFWQLLVVPDLVVLVLLSSSISAALAIAQVGKKGNYNAAWLPICGRVHKFCEQVTGALAVGLIGIIVYMLLLIFSFYSLLYPIFV